MKFPLFQVDAFTSRLFGGNPAAVCPLDSWPEKALLQSIAAENNLSETAFLVKEEGGYALRWFTPKSEIELCGHATLASAFVIFRFLDPELEEARFTTLSGLLTVVRAGEHLMMNFPADAFQPCTPPEPLLAGLEKAPREVFVGNYYMAVYDTEEEIRSCAPHMEPLTQLDRHGVVITAPGRDVDFVSRFFAPKVGIPEDPVTGSAHCMTTPYWAARLGKGELKARQLSGRGGEVLCALRGERVLLSGSAVLYMRGEVEVP